MEAARTSETLVNFYQTTRRYNPEDSHLRTHRRENLKSYDCEGTCQSVSHISEWTSALYWYLQILVVLCSWNLEKTYKVLALKVAYDLNLAVIMKITNERSLLPSCVHTRTSAADKFPPVGRRRCLRSADDEGRSTNSAKQMFWYLHIANRWKHLLLYIKRKLI
jgi:hypothetical protein